MVRRRHRHRRQASRVHASSRLCPCAARGSLPPPHVGRAAPLTTSSPAQPPPHADGSLFFATPYDPLFLVLPVLVKHRNKARSCQSPPPCPARSSPAWKNSSHFPDQTLPHPADRRVRRPLLQPRADARDGGPPALPGVPRAAPAAPRGGVRREGGWRGAVLPPGRRPRRRVPARQGGPRRGGAPPAPRAPAPRKRDGTAGGQLGVFVAFDGAHALASRSPPPAPRPPEQALREHAGPSYQALGQPELRAYVLELMGAPHCSLCEQPPPKQRLGSSPAAPRATHSPAADPLPERSGVRAPGPMDLFAPRPARVRGASHPHVPLSTFRDFVSRAAGGLSGFPLPRAGAGSPRQPPPRSPGA